MQDVMLLPAALITALAIPSMHDDAIACVGRFEALALAQPQAELATHHVLHDGLYARTIMIPSGVAITGALIEIATTVIVSGDCAVSQGDRCERLTGYHVLAASAHRKLAFLAYADTHLTMVFATSAQSVEEAEDQFTAEADRLMSRQPGHANTVVVTGQ
jgi:hypothetical protein